MLKPTELTRVMTVLVTGSRDWIDEPAISEVLVELDIHREVPGCRCIPGGPAVLVHGGAAGADRIAARFAKELGWKVIGYPADWRPNGPRGQLDRHAGTRRNQQMLDQHPEVNIVVAFPLPQSIGTPDMIRRARKAGKEVRVYRRLKNGELTAREYEGKR